MPCHLRKTELMTELSRRLRAGLLRKLSWFSLVGLIAAGMYVLVSAALVNWLGLSPHLATALGVTAGASISYFGHRTLTFRAEGSHRTHAPRFVGQLIFTYALNGCITWFIYEYLSMSTSAAIFIVAAVVITMNFFLYDLYTFSQSNA
jgi:putative flippase GtrA